MKITRWKSQIAFNRELFYREIRLQWWYLQSQNSVTHGGRCELISYTMYNALYINRIVHKHSVMFYGFDTSNGVNLTFKISKGQFIRTLVLEQSNGVNEKTILQ